MSVEAGADKRRNRNLIPPPNAWIRFRGADHDAFLDEFTCVVADYDDYKRNIKFKHPETQFDDALHATTYAQSLALRVVNKVRRYN